MSPPWHAAPSGHFLATHIRASNKSLLSSTVIASAPRQAGIVLWRIDILQNGRGGCFNLRHVVRVRGEQPAQPHLIVAAEYFRKVV